jgi:hypothetical protein
MLRLRILANPTSYTHRRASLDVEFAATLHDTLSHARRNKTRSFLSLATVSVSGYAETANKNCELGVSGIVQKDTGPVSVPGC